MGKSVISICILLIFTPLDSFSQEYFNPNDPLGNPYGRMNRNPSELPTDPDWVDNVPKTKDINFPDVYTPEQGSRSNGNIKTNQKNKFKKMSADEFGRSYEDSIDKIFKNYQDKNEYAKVYSYDPEQSSDPRRANGVDEFNDSVEEKKGIWVEFLSGIGALLLIVIPTYFYFKSLK